jgi:hypothetical protein
MCQDGWPIKILQDPSCPRGISYQVDHFEVQWDSQAWMPLAVTGRVLPDTGPEALSYTVIPPFSNGWHTVSFRACSVAAGCGGSSSPFRLRIRHHATRRTNEFSGSGPLIA